MDLSIIIVNYRATKQLLACLKSVAESDLSGIEYEVIVVDNGAIENIKDQFKEDNFSTTGKGKDVEKKNCQDCGKKLRQEYKS